MSVDYTKLALAIVTWNRPANLERALASWIATIPLFRRGFIINNSIESVWGAIPKLDYRRYRTPGIEEIMTGRPAEHVGNLAQSWNLAMLWAFRDPEVEWLLCSQDDMEAKPGWPEAVAKVDADLYLAPAGDQAFLFNRRVLREVGWFDERFTTIGYQDWDWEARAMLALPRERLSIEDGHGWRVNPIGLHDYWTRQVPEYGYKSEAHIAKNQEWLERKWGGDLGGMLRGNGPPAPLLPEIEWYPWFSRV